MISELRQRVRQNVFGATITAEEYDQLLREWITRAGAEELVAAESAACATAIRAAALECDDDAEAHGMRFAAGILDKRANAKVKGCGDGK